MARMLTTVAIAYVTTNLGYMLLSYYPTRELGWVVGNIVELLVWLAVCTAAYLALGKLPSMRSERA